MAQMPEDILHLAFRAGRVHALREVAKSMTEIKDRPVYEIVNCLVTQARAEECFVTSKVSVPEEFQKKED